MGSGVVGGTDGEGFFMCAAQQEFDFGITFKQINRAHDGRDAGIGEAAAPQVDGVTVWGLGGFQIAIIQWIVKGGETRMGRASGTIDADGRFDNEAIKGGPKAVGCKRDWGHGVARRKRVKGPSTGF